MTFVDLRSDTLTMPTEGMRRAMSEAELGDDVFGEDPTVNRLQRRAAELMGKEDALFVASGTMGNLLGVVSLARSGEEVITDAHSHLFLAEGAGASALGGIQLRQVQTETGVMSADQVRTAIRPRDDVHEPLTAAVCVENTHNRHGGVVWPLAELRAVGQTTRRSGLALHMDGARLFNAAVALGVSAETIAAEADTVTFCVSKGLGAPVGSVLCGPTEVIDRARRWRKMIGGGWREGGCGPSSTGSGSWPWTTPTPARWQKAWPRWTGSASTWTASRPTSSSSGRQRYRRPTSRSPAGSGACSALPAATAESASSPTWAWKPRTSSTPSRSAAKCSVSRQRSNQPNAFTAAAPGGRRQRRAPVPV